MGDTPSGFVRLKFLPVKKKNKHEKKVDQKAIDVSYFNRNDKEEFKDFDRFDKEGFRDVYNTEYQRVIKGNEFKMESDEKIVNLLFQVKEELVKGNLLYDEKIEQLIELMIQHSKQSGGNWENLLVSLLEWLEVENGKDKKDKDWNECRAKTRIKTEIDGESFGELGLLGVDVSQSKNEREVILVDQLSNTLMENETIKMAEKEIQKTENEIKLRKSRGGFGMHLLELVGGIFCICIDKLKKILNSKSQLFQHRFSDFISKIWQKTKPQTTVKRVRLLGNEKEPALRTLKRKKAIIAAKAAVDAERLLEEQVKAKEKFFFLSKEVEQLVGEITSLKENVQGRKLDGEQLVGEIAEVDGEIVNLVDKIITLKEKIPSKIPAKLEVQLVSKISELTCKKAALEKKVLQTTPISISNLPRPRYPTPLYPHHHPDPLHSHCPNPFHPDYIIRRCCSLSQHPQSSFQSSPSPNPYQFPSVCV